MSDDLRALLGDVAELGTGMPRPGPISAPGSTSPLVDDALRARLRALGLTVMLEADPTAIYAIRLTSKHRAAAEDLAAAVRAAWGAGDARDREADGARDRHTYWTDASRGRRACLFTTEDPRAAVAAELEVGTFDRPDAFLAKPAWDRVGAKVGEVRDWLGATARVGSDASLVWLGPGIGLGTGATTWTARVDADRGVVASISAFAIVEPEVKQAVRSALTARYGEPTTQRSVFAAWQRDAPIQLKTYRGMSLIVGEPIEAAAES